MNVMTTNSSADAPHFEEAYQHYIGGNRTNGLAWFIPCDCCEGSGEHDVGVGPRADSYPCDSCQGYGYFEVVHSNGWRV